MPPLTPFGLAVIGIFLIVHALTPLPAAAWIAVGVIAVVCGLVDLTIRGNVIR